MNNYEITYNYKGYSEIQNIDAYDILSAIGQFLENNNIKLSDIIRIELSEQPL